MMSNLDKQKTFTLKVGSDHSQLSFMNVKPESLEKLKEPLKLLCCFFYFI